MKTNIEKATPRPWILMRDDKINPIITIFSTAKEYSIAETQGDDNTEAEANAELIIRAVNAHDDLVRACQAVFRGDADMFQLCKDALNKANGKEG